MAQDSFTYDDASKPVARGFSYEDASSEPPRRTALDVAKDVGITALKGAVGLPQSVVGVADLVTGGQAGKAVEDAGVRFKDTQAFLADQYSDAQKAANRKVADADGFVGTAQAMLENPSTIATSVGESIPQMLGGAGVARGVLAAGAKVAPAIAGAIGEGVLGAGSQAEQIRQETQDGLLTPKQAGLAAASGVTTAAFGAAGGRAAQRLGIGDADTMLAQGSIRGAGPASQRSLARQVGEGVLSEGVLEEVPQSMAEQALQNLALDKPVGEGVGASAAQGLLAGGAMGGGAALVHGVGARGEPSAAAPAPAPAPDPLQLGYQPDTLVAFPDGTVGRQAEVDAYLARLPENQRAAARANLMGLAPQPSPPTTETPAGAAAARAAPPPSQAMGIDPAAGPLSTGAAIAVDSGAHGQLLQDAQRQADAAALTEQEQATAANRAAPPVLDYSDLDERDRSLYDDYFRALDRETEGHMATALADDVPDFGGRNVTDEQFLRALGANDQEIADAIQVARGAAGPEERAGGAAAPAADVPEGSRPAVGAAPVQQGQAEPAQAVAATAAASATAPTSVQDGIAQARARRAPEQASFADDPARWASRTQERAKSAVATKVGEVSGATIERAPARDGNPFDMPTFRAVDAQGNVIGSLAVLVEGKTGTGVIEVAPGSRRKGIATALYQAAEKNLGVTMKPERTHTDAAAAFWAQPNRPFGNAVDEASHEAATSPRNDRAEPTQAQKEAGNYKMGHLSGDEVQGLRISIENPQGSTRSGKSPDGKAWSNNMAAHYGYVKGSEAADGDHVDVFVGPNASTAPTVYVVDQVNADGSYDEAKALFGFNSEAEALAAYKGSYDANWKVGPVTAMSVDEFKAGLASGRFKKPLSEQLVSKPSEPVDTPATPGEYRVQTVVGRQVERQLGAASITNLADLAAATQYLYRSAVERFDAIVTDAAGKPLAVVGGFKGAVSQASVYPATIMGEAVRVPGAAHIWFSHNHPSGDATLSQADQFLERTLRDAFRGTGIEPMGLIAVGNGRWEGTDGNAGSIAPSTAQTKVPVIERELSTSNAGEALSSPDAAQRIGKAYYEQAKTPGLILLDSQNKVAAWVPLSPAMQGKLRHTGQLRALYRAISESNARSAILVHQGELDAPLASRGGVTIGQNIGAALNQVDVRPLDVVNARTGRSAAQLGETMALGPVFRRTPRDGTEAMSPAVANAMQALSRPTYSPQARTQAVATVRKTVDAIRSAWGNAPDIVVAFDMNDAAVPEAARRADLRQRSGGARGAPEGFYYRGRAYLMASRLATPEDAARVLYHEVLGHHGLRGTFGKQLDGVLNQIATMRRAEVDAKVREYGLRGVNKLDRRAAAEEVLAEMAQNTPELHFVRRAVAAIRTWLRQHVPGFRGLRLTDDEIIRNFILPARAFVERSAGAAAPRAGLAFSRAEGIDPDAESRAFLDGAPVAQMTGKEFAPDGVPITEKVTQHYATTGNAQVEVPGIGLVSLDRQAVKSSLFHGIGRDKATAFAAVPDVLKNGKIIHAEAMEGARDAGMVYHVAAPVRIGDRDMVEVVLVKADSNAKRMYVHEVVLREKLRQPAVEAGAGAAGAGVQTRADAGAIRSVLDRIYSVNPAPGDPTSSGQTSTPAFRAWFGDSKVVDAQGAPLEVFHGTTAQFTAFDPSKKGTATGAKSAAGGFFFAADRSTAETYASNLFATARRARADRDRAIETIKQLTGEENVERAQFDFFRGKFDGSGSEDAIDRAIEKRQQAEAKLENIGDDYFGPSAQRAKGAQVIGAYLSIKNPLVHDQQGQISRDASFSELIAQARSEGRDGVIIRNTQDDGSRNDAEDSTTDVYIAFEPGQIKSATGNAGTFDESDPDIMFSRSTVGEYARTAATELNKTFSAPGRLSWWHKTIGTMYNLAARSSAFKPVFDAAQGFVDDVSHYATDAAELAPKLLPKLETWRDIKKSPISAADNTAVAKPVFEGTLTWARDEQGAPVQVQTLIDAAAGLTSEQKAQRLLRNGMLDERMLKAWQGMPLESYEKAVASRYESRMLQPGVVWSDAELRSMFQLTDDQVALYREFREATNRSLDTMARADMLRFAGDDAKGLRTMVMDAPDAQAAAVLIRDHLAQLAGDQPDRATLLMNTANGIMDRADKVRDLQARGYAPLSRFGRYSVDVVDAKGERQYFGLFETARDANTMAARMRGEFGEAAVSQGTLSEEAFKMFAGVTPETLELFGNALGLDSTGDRAQDQAFQEYLKLTKTNRSAMRRLIHRKGIAGFSEDVGRVLASFIYSNARQTAAGLNLGNLGEAVNAIPKEQGELKDVAVRLAEYVKNPQEEAQAVRGLLFAQYLGGSIASAFVNMTQPAAVTFPWLSQFGGARKAAAALGTAAKNMVTKGFEFEPDLARALKTAEDEGVVAPQEVHQLMAQARGSGSLRAGDGTRLGGARAAGQNALARLSLAWGKVFGAAEQVNRRITFIAAYRVARDRGEADPAAFANRAVRETQFVYSKASKMQWGRGAVGGTLMTFKTYSIAYLELLHRMYTQGGPEGKRAALLALGMLMLMGGSGGLPFAEDAEDVADALAQLLGYNFSAKKARQEVLEAMLPKGIADFLDKGVSGLPGAPLDVSGRLGMGNLIPGTGLLQQKTSHTRDVLEIAGPAGDFASRIFSGALNVAKGNVGAGALEVAPTAVRNAAKGVDMAATGMYRDAKGYKVLETNHLEAALKAIGFQPQSVATIQEANSLNQRAKAFYNLRAQEIRAQWAAGIFEKDDAKVRAAREAIADWNAKNPDQRMVIRIPSVLERAREMSKSKDQRIADTAPRAMRARMQEELARARADAH